MKLNLRILCLLVLFTCILQINTIKISCNRQLGQNLQKKSSKSSKHSQIEFESVVIQAIGLLFQLNNISNNYQYRNCFSNQEYLQLDENIIKGLNIGKLLGQNDIQTYPKLIKDFLTSKFQKKSFDCFFGSNDLRRLMLNYRIQNIGQASQTFQNYSYQKYSDTHDAFLTLIQLINKKDSMELSSFTSKLLTKMFKSSQQDPNYDQWGIQALDPQLNLYPYYGITISNGIIGAVSDKMPLTLSKTVLAGTYDKYGRGRVDNIVETMNLMDTQLFIDDQKFPFIQKLNFRQYIDFKNGEFKGSYSIREKASVSFRYMALKNSAETFYLQIIVTAHQDIQLLVKNTHRVPQYLNNIQKQYQILPNKQKYRVMTTKATTKTGKIDLAMCSTFFIADQNKHYLTGENFNHEDWDSEMHKQTIENLKLPKGAVFKFYLVSSLISTEQHSDPKNQAARLMLKVAATNPQQLISKHRELWADLWSNDIIIEGNSQDQQTIRSMVYHFYSFINQFKNYGLSPMGLSGLGYNGHVFWDMDLWMYPAVLILNPKLAKSLIQYRYNRLQAARNNAFLNGYKGAMYPWQSSKSGDQQCPIWAAPGPLEHHISGTVAVAAWKYYCVTKDVEWLKQKGRPMIQGIAQFWQSRVQKDQNGVYHIKNVVAADQWAQNVDDDAFTNAVAIESLRIANKMRQVLNLQVNPNWNTIRRNIPIYSFPDTNVTKQYATYTGENIKQADVNLLAFPLKQITQKTAILRDLQFYENKVPKEGTPAMTHSIFALLYSRLNDANSSYKWFKYSFTKNKLTPFGVLAQTQLGTNPYFLTGAGGILQSVIFGYAGIDITDQGVVKVQSVIPNEWSRLVIKSPVIQTTNSVKFYQQNSI